VERTIPTICRPCAGAAIRTRGPGDATDFRRMRESYAMREPGCPFCELDDGKLVAENPLAVLIHDGFPVTDGHMLAIPPSGFLVPTHSRPYTSSDRFGPCVERRETQTGNRRLITKLPDAEAGESHCYAALRFADGAATPAE
jgi:hypothetical protein